jgi:hypothetical protein
MESKAQFAVSTATLTSSTALCRTPSKFVQGSESVEAQQGAITTSEREIISDKRNLSIADVTFAPGQAEE